MRVDILDESEMKSNTGKDKWRTFIAKFDKLEDFAFGTLIRSNSALEFSETNSMFVIRIQFLAIEIARNREGFNDHIRKSYQFKPKVVEDDV